MWLWEYSGSIGFFFWVIEKCAVVSQSQQYLTPELYTAMHTKLVVHCIDCIS